VACGTYADGHAASSHHVDAPIEANRIKGQAAAGLDPAADWKTKAEAQCRKRGATLGRLAETYGAVLERRPKMRGTGNATAAKVAEERTQIRLAMGELGGEEMPAAAFGVADLSKLLDRLGGAVGCSQAVRCRP
jgi:hypothetical protein